MEGRTKVILVIEDERPLLEAIKRKLENSGIEAVTARSAEQGIAYLAELEQVDAVWLDHYLLGRESGLDFVMHLKEANSKWRSIPVFVVSNTASDDKVNAYMRLGVEKYYVKSNIRLDQIINSIVSHLANGTDE